MAKCSNCIYKGNVPGDTHIQCVNYEAKVVGDSHGIDKGWFFWPFNFDPTWLISCSGFKGKEDVK